MVELSLFLLELVVEVVFQAAVETVFDLGLASRKSPEHSTDSRVLVLVGLLILGALVGGASLALWPGRLFSPGPVPGMSLVLGPLAVGGVMLLWGKHRRARGKVTSSLATFEGGAAFALGTALVRFVWAG